MSNSNQYYLDDSHRVERDKELLAFHKHLATLNTAAIGFLAIIGKDFGDSVAKHAGELWYAIYMFAGSLILTLICYGISLFLFFGFHPQKKSSRKGWALTYELLSFVAAALFVVAVVLVAYVGADVFELLSKNSNK